MSNVKIVLNSKGIQELLKSPGITEAVRSVCRDVSERAGDGYSSNVITGKKRAVGRVFANNKSAVRDNYENNTLLKALK